MYAEAEDIWLLSKTKVGPILLNPFLLTPVTPSPLQPPLSLVWDTFSAIISAPLSSSSIPDPSSRNRPLFLNSPILAHSFKFFFHIQDRTDPVSVSVSLDRPDNGPARPRDPPRLG